MPKIHTDAERIALFVHMLILTRRIEHYGRSVTALENDSIEKAEQFIVICNRLVKAIVRADAIDAWIPPFAEAAPLAKAVRAQWSGLERLRNAYEHEEDRVSDFDHIDRGEPISVRRRVLGYEIPFFSDGFMAGADGPETVWFLGVTYDLRPAVSAIKALREALTPILVDERDRLRAEPLG